MLGHIEVARSARAVIVNAGFEPRLAGSAELPDNEDVQVGVEGGRHLGGQIIPGVRLMAASLASETSDIPVVQRSAPGSGESMDMFANTTAGAVGQGALNAVAGAVERALRILCEQGSDPEVVLTGGDASRILRSLHDAVHHRPHLVLQGLARILEDRQ